MPAAPLVLHVGTDLALLNTRSAVLESAGMAVVRASNSAEALRLFTDADFDAVVLCHSIPPDQCRRIERAVHASRPSVPVLVLQSISKSTGAVRRIGNATFSVPPNPPVMLKSIARTATGHPPQ